MDRADGILWPSATGRVLMRASADSQLGKLIKQSFAPGSTADEREVVRKELAKATEAIASHNPGAGQRLREGALYVDPNDSGTGWKRPAEVSPDLARHEIQSVANDYGVFCGNLQHGDDRFRAVLATLERWPDRPPLPDVQHPKFP